ADGFDQGFSRWDFNTGLTVGPTAGATGPAAIRDAAPGRAAQAWRRLWTKRSELWARVRVRPQAQGAGPAGLLALGTRAGPIGRLEGAGDGPLAVRGPGGATLTSRKALPLGQWHELQLHATLAGGGRVEAFLDGKKVQ